ncbi:MAG: holo-ACP synthase [Bacillota bacterium]|nr:holo-ACP synthase [Bacillota bacterium]
MGVLCGIDIIEIDRVQKSIEAHSSFINKVFSDREIELCNKRKSARFQSYAARFAAKEAVSKAFGTGIGKDVGWKEIEILSDENGKPVIQLSGKSEELYKRIGAVDISISLSHCTNTAVACAVIQTNL